MNQFIPDPIDTRRVVLSAELAQLSERLAENAHDVWARKKLQDGWTYGPILDEGARTTPMLVAYGALPDSAKEYDRVVVIQTLKAICALGFEIIGPDATS